jgi:hypothetical protein
MPDFERVALFKRRTNDSEGVWVATELERAWMHGCPAAVTAIEPRPLRNGTGKITAVDRKEYMRDLMRKRRAVAKEKEGSQE